MKNGDVSSDITHVSVFLHIVQKRVEDLEKNLLSLLSKQNERIEQQQKSVHILQEETARFIHLSRVRKAVKSELDHSTNIS